MFVRILSVKIAFEFDRVDARSEAGESYNNLYCSLPYIDKENRYFEDFYPLKNFSVTFEFTES
jgi:hypothetical protein